VRACPGAVMIGIPLLCMLLMRFGGKRGRARGGELQEKAVQKVLRKLKKRSGAMSVLAEFSRDERLIHHDLSDFSRACRSHGACV
jgi:hypothetical protein